MAKLLKLFLGTLTLLLKFIYFVIEAPIRNIVSLVYVPQKDVNGEVVLITGAGSGVGRLLAIKFAALGATVVLVDVNREANDAVAAEIRHKGQLAHAYQCDCSKRKDVYQVAAKVKEEVGDVTILINNAGIVSGKKFSEIPDDKVDLTFQVNTVAHFWVSGCRPLRSLCFSPISFLVMTTSLAWPDRSSLPSMHTKHVGRLYCWNGWCLYHLTRSRWGVYLMIQVLKDTQLYFVQ